MNKVQDALARTKGRRGTSLARHRFEATSIWKRTLSRVSNDPHAAERDLLRTEFLKMRRLVEPLVEAAHKDCEGLTVHNITHLDALWETADQICGPHVQLTPVEGFLLGAAILLHDAGMAVAAYPGGIAGVRNTAEWTDSAKVMLIRAQLSDGDFSALPPESKRAADFAALRKLHAKQAEKLATTSFEKANGEDHLPLIDNEELRSYYGQTIGKIAHSHHWDVDVLIDQLRTELGAYRGFPPEWSANPVKVACILRCADAAHIDADRAPTMLFALNRPIGISYSHWNFQNHLLKAQVRDNELIYTSGRTFSKKDASAWWLCFDTVKMIDREIRDSNTLLDEIGEQPFRVRGVAGADSPRALAKHVETQGWSPVDAQIKVSDPVHLAKTLGGENLYGNSVFVPLRELVQNAIDAVRARRLEEARENDWGFVKLTIEESSDGASWLHVDDSGLGMSERVLVDTLLDFGSSFWMSSQIQEEYPGLISKGLKPTGKFGIGFFSTFLLGDSVKVVSKPFLEGYQSARALEFSSVDRRPLVRPADRNELPPDVNTRVSVALTGGILENLRGRVPLDDQEEEDEDDFARDRKDAAQYLTRLVAGVDVNVTFEDAVVGRQMCHAPMTTTMTLDGFIDKVAEHKAMISEREVRLYKALISPIVEDNQRVVGLAALHFLDDLNHLGAFVSVNGLVYPNSSRLGIVEDHHDGEIPYVGLIEGDITVASRDNALPVISSNAIKSWATEQATRVYSVGVEPARQMYACHLIIGLGGDPGPLPFAFSTGRFVTMDEVSRRLPSLESVLLPLTSEYRPSFLAADDLTSAYFTMPMREDVLILHAESQVLEGISSLEDEDDETASPVILPKTLERGAQEWPLSLLIELLVDAWGVVPLLDVRKTQIFRDSLLAPPDERWCLTLERRNALGVSIPAATSRQS